MSEQTGRESAPTESGASEVLESGHLGRWQLVSLAVSSMMPAIGISIVPFLLVTADRVSALPAIVLSVLAVGALGVVVVFFARRYVASGSIYSYVGEAFGPWARYFAGGALLVGFVLQVTCIVGLVGIFVGSFLASIGVSAAQTTGWHIVILVVATIIGVYIPIRGIDTSVRTVVILTVVSVPFAVLITVISAVRTGLDLPSQLDFGSITVGGLLQAVAVGTALFIGFESCSAMASESRNPRRNVPYAVMSVSVMLGLVYIAATVLQIQGLEKSTGLLAEGKSPIAALAVNAGLGSGIANVTDLVLAVATFASLIGFINFGSRFVLTLAEDGLLPAKVALVDRKFRSPFVAILILGAVGLATLVALLVTSSSLAEAYNSAATLIVYVWVLPYLLVTSAAVVLIARHRLRSPWVVVSAVFGGAMMAYCFINGVINPPPQTSAMTWVAIIVIPVTTVFLVLNRKLRSRHDGER